MLPIKRKNSGITAPFTVNYRLQPGEARGWHLKNIDGWMIYVEADKDYETYSPRHVAIAEGMREFWRQNHGMLWTWRDTIAVQRQYLRDTPNAGKRSRVYPISRSDYNRSKEIIRELAEEWVNPRNGEVYVYSSTRGPQAASGFVTQQIAAEIYDGTNQKMIKKMIGRVVNGTVIPAGQEFGVPVKKKAIPTKTLT